MKKNKFIWVGLSAIVLGTAGFFLYDAFNKNKISENTNNSNTEPLEDSSNSDSSSPVRAILICLIDSSTILVFIIIPYLELHCFKSGNVSCSFLNFII